VEHDGVILETTEVAVFNMDKLTRLCFKQKPFVSKEQCSQTNRFGGYLLHCNCVLSTLTYGSIVVVFMMLIQAATLNRLIHERTRMFTVEGMEQAAHRMFNITCNACSNVAVLFPLTGQLECKAFCLH
jgi:hypothetical protein